ncbi:hypothetical protein RBSWK_00341 [Rhodopirellula baltica SWK14]|uniref:DUF2007 domain-containing protein n=2 Tax=Rhodopirellula baltica TaxID=265606 RepID=L7CRC3_RHOBT|nr:hypothetical protein RBSWK_00341 [Rhodopirellula baltica SWK14]
MSANLRAHHRIGLWRMSLPSPTVVYRTRNYQEAESAAACLLRAGINTRLNSPKPIGHMVEGPVFDILHEVLAADCTEAEVEQLLSQWRSKNRSTDPNKPPFCYHCGETLTSMIAVCPACGNPLDCDPETSSQSVT